MGLHLRERHEGVALDQALASAPAMPADSRSPMMAKIDQPERSDLSIGRAERPRGSAAEQRDELAPFRSITSSVWASNVGEIVMPSVFAAYRP